MDAADGRFIAGVAKWLFGEVMLEIRFKPTDLRSSSIWPVIWLFVAELMAGILWQIACKGELHGNQLAMLANC